MTLDSESEREGAVPSSSTIFMRCMGAIRHGPGSQSHTHCEIRYPHTVHFARDFGWDDRKAWWVDDSEGDDDELEDQYLQEKDKASCEYKADCLSALSRIKASIRNSARAASAVDFALLERAIERVKI